MHSNAVIISTLTGLRFTQCPKCQERHVLHPGFVHGSHLWCKGCGENLLLQELSMGELENFNVQKKCTNIVGYGGSCGCEICNASRRSPFGASPEAVKAHNPIHDGTDAWPCCECDNCKAWRRSDANKLPVTFVQGSYNIETGETIEPLHQRVGRIDRIKLTMTSERDSIEADSAQALYLTRGVTPYLLITLADRGESMTKGLQDWQTAVRIQQFVGMPLRPSLASPLAIQMLMHFHAYRERFIAAPVSCWPEAQRAIVEGFKAKGLIFERDHEDFGTTDKGSLIVATLTAVMSESLRNV